MARASRLYLRVGSLIVMGFALLVGFILFLTAGRFGDQGTLFETYLRESVQGLDVGSSVRYRGVAIGRVTEVGLVTAQYPPEADTPYTGLFQLVLVRFAVETSRLGPVPPLDQAIALGLRTRLASQGITGQSYLELDFLDSVRGSEVPRLPWQPRFGFIPSVPSTVAAVTTAAENLIARIDRLDIEALLNGLTALVGDLRTQVAGEGEVNRLVREASTTLQSIQLTVGAVQAVVSAPEMRSLLVNSSQAAAELRTAMARLPNAIRSLEASLRTVRSVAGDTQADLTPILRDLRATSANLRETSESLRRSPAQAIFGGPPERR